MQDAQFLSVLEQMIPAQQFKAICERHAPRPRTARKLTSEALVSSLIFHQLHCGGTLAEHAAQLHGIRMSDSAFSQRRQLLPVELFDQIMQVALQPLADPVRQPQSFYEGYRHPAETLARHYAERWEHELYYRELKLDVRNTPILASHTLETALQEVSAVVLASAVLARLRVAAADELKLPAGRMSFFKMMLATQQLWNTLEFIGAQLSQAQRDQVWEKYMDAVRHTAVLRERRERSCPRASYASR